MNKKQNTVLGDWAGAGSAILLESLQNAGIFGFEYFPQEKKVLVPEETQKAWGSLPVFENMPDSMLEFCVDPHDWEKCRAMYQAIDDGAETAQSLVRLKDRVSWSRVTVTTIERDEEGRPVRAIALTENLTDSKTRETEMAAKNHNLNVMMQVFQAAADATDTIVFIYDMTRQSILVADATAAQFGVFTEQTGVPYEYAYSGLVHPASINEYIRIHEEMINGARSASGKIMLIDVDGNSGFYELSFKALVDENGLPTGKAAGVYTNVTEYHESYLHQYAMNKSLSEGVAAVFSVDLDEDSVAVESLSEDLRPEVVSFVAGLNGTYAQAFTQYCLDYIHPDDQERMITEFNPEVIKKRLKSKRSYYVQYRVKHHLTGHGYFELHISASQEEDKKNRIFISFRCIDEQKEKEIEQQNRLAQALDATRVFARRASENLELLQGIIGSGFWCLEFEEDGSLSKTTINQELCEILGYEDEEDLPGGIGEILNRQLHPEDRDGVTEAFWSCAFDGSDYDHRYRIYKKNGDLIWVHSAGMVKRYPNGRPRIYSGTFTDITERQKKERMQDIINSVFSIYTASWIINIPQDTFSELSVPDTHALKKSLSSLRAHRALDNLASYLIEKDKDLQSMRDFLNMETMSSRIRCASSISFEFQREQQGWFSANLIPIKRDQKGQIIELVLALRPIEEEKQKELQVKQALEEAFHAAQKANEAKSEFLSHMSHDIRTPMNAIMGMTGAALMHFEDPSRVKDCLKKISISSQHLLGIVNEVLDMSKIESGKFSLNNADFSLTDLTEKLTVMLAPQIEANRQTLEVDLDDIEHPYVRGDSQRLMQAFTNLMSNAVKYTPEGGTIRFSMKEKSPEDARVGCYVFTFEDNGIGMSQEFLEHLYEPFSRENESMHGAQGTGLGMPITKNIVEMMNGHIDVESAPGKGTTFTVTIFLPLQSGHAPSSEAVPSEVNTQKLWEQLKNLNFSGRRVLLAEDNELNAEIAGDILETAGISVDYAYDGLQAVDRAVSAEPGYYDLILMDIHMPVMNGYEASRQIRNSVRKDLQELPIVAVTANAFAEDIEAARMAGMNGHLTKPINIAQLVKVLKTNLG